MEAICINRMALEGRRGGGGRAGHFPNKVLVSYWRQSALIKQNRKQIWLESVVRTLVERPQLHVRNVPERCVKTRAIYSVATLAQSKTRRRYFFQISFSLIFQISISFHLNLNQFCSKFKFKFLLLIEILVLIISLFSIIIF